MMGFLISSYFDQQVGRFFTFLAPALPWLFVEDQMPTAFKLFLQPGGRVCCIVSMPIHRPAK